MNFFVLHDDNFSLFAWQTSLCCKKKSIMWYKPMRQVMMHLKKPSGLMTIIPKTAKNLLVLWSNGTASSSCSKNVKCYPQRVSYSKLQLDVDS